MSRYKKVAFRVHKNKKAQKKPQGFNSQGAKKNFEQDYTD
jgi:hypothetical protein